MCPHQTWTDMLLEPVPLESMALIGFTPQTHQILITQQIGSMEQISKQDTSQKRQLWETRYLIGTLYTELTFSKIANWFRCFPRLL